MEPNPRAEAKRGLGAAAQGCQGVGSCGIAFPAPAKGGLECSRGAWAQDGGGGAVGMRP